MGNYTIPYVVERTANGERSSDVFSRLLSERIIFLGTEIDDGVANVVIAQLLHLESSAPENEIAIYLNSPGGSFTSLMAIYDTMTFVQAPISTFCVGQWPPRLPYCWPAGIRGDGSCWSTRAYSSGSRPAVAAGA